MRAKTTIVSSLLCALLVLGFALSAQAKVTYQVQTSPLNAIKNGAAEVMGDVSLTVSASPVDTGISSNDQITITYAQSAITPSQAVNNLPSGLAIPGVAVGPDGLTVTATANFPAFLMTVNPNVPSIGGTVTIRFLADIPAGTLVPGTDTITVSNVRSSVVGRAISSIVITQFTAAPAGSSSFIVTSAPTVAFVVDNFSISSDTLGNRVAICQPSGLERFTIKEESLTTWVQYTTAGGNVSPSDGRSTLLLRAGGNSNSEVHFVLNGLPTGVTINWPGTILSNEQISIIPAQNSNLSLVSQSASGNDAIYTFSTPSQSASDATVESYTFTFAYAASGTVPGTIVVTSATPPGSATTLQVQEYPPDTPPFAALPRFADPLRSAIDSGTFVDCVTNLLFPWVGSLPDFGYDTGIAIANTGYDVGAITPTTTGDDGTINFYFYPQTFGAAPVAPTPVTTAVIVPGDTYAAPFSSFGASKFGYLIAVCQFRFAHGFAYITQGTIGGTLDTAQGYLALVMETGTGSGARGFVESLGE